MLLWRRASLVGFKIPHLPTGSIPETQSLLLDGKRVADEFATQCLSLGADYKIKPKLVVILPGEDPASQVYVRNKESYFKRVGFLTETIRIPSTQCTKEVIEAHIERLNNDSSVHGILVQLPLPNRIDSTVLNSISFKKDVDGFHPMNAGLLASGHFSGNLPCTPFGMMVLLAANGIDVSGKNAVVVGRSNIVGKPMAQLLLSANATVTVAHTKTVNLKEVCLRADILVAAAGVMHIIKKDMVKKGAVVLDVGIHKDENNKLAGDVEKDVRYIAGALSPVPGGVGPMTIAMLCVNTAIAAWSI